MSIPGVNDLKRVTDKTVVDMEQGLINEPTRADIEAFSSLMDRSQVGQPTQSGAFLAETVGGRMQSADRLASEAMHSIKQAITDADPGAMTEMSRTLSQLSLETAVTAKVISKGGQALEKLTNMQ